MNKSILIIDTPIRCEDCELCRDGYLCLRLGEVGESVENGTKDLRCPLKPLPETIGGEYPEDYDAGFGDGWDACLKEITGE